MLDPEVGDMNDLNIINTFFEKEATKEMDKKEANVTACEDQRTRSFLTHASKIVITTLTKTASKNGGSRWKTRRPFRILKGMGTRDAIGRFRVLTESCQNGYIFLVYYDYTRDRVDWRRLIQALRKMGVNWRYNYATDRNLYMGPQIRIRIEGEYSEPGKLGRVVRQGCSLSPIFFNIYIVERFTETLEEMGEEIKVRTLRFADYQALMAGSQRVLQITMDQ